MNIKTGVVCAIIAVGGCGGEGDAPGDNGITVRQQALHPGNWGNHTNGLVVGSGGITIGNLIVCRAAYDDGQHPGKVWQGQCLFGWGGVEKKEWSFEKLLDEGYKWVNPGFWSGSQWVFPLPSNAVDGGSAGFMGNYARMGVCQVKREGNWHPGKWYADHCNYGYAGREQRAQPLPNDPGDYVQVLVTR